MLPLAHLTDVRCDERAFLMVVFTLSVATGGGLLRWTVETIREWG
jgi:hypothetical protein